jgi:RAC serine/threonine-protein kinase
MSTSKSGWVIKEGGRYKSWRKRWLVLEGKQLSYYKKDNKKEKCGIIPLKNAKVEVYVNYKDKKNCFQIKTEYRNFMMTTRTETEMLYWKQVILNAIDGSGGQSINVPMIDTINPEFDLYEEKDKQTIGPENFDLLKVIGKGSFGKVFLVRKKDTQKVYAMKVLNKKIIIEKNEVEHTKSEKSILMKLDFPFLVKMHFAFQTEDKLYFVMDYINGGELFYHLTREKRFSEDRVRFYAAEIVAAIEYLHDAGVIYRDLKPENILLTNSGHVVVTDFGLSKEGLHDPDDITTTFCGTPEYLAPEILEGKGYTKAVDWWSFGTMMFEMLTGLPPFYTEDVQQMYTKILTTNLEIPKTMSNEAAELLRGLLERDVEKRLQDPREIKSQKFFKSIDWDQLVQCKITPPFVPNVRGEDDTGNFEATFTSTAVKLHDEEDPGPPLPSQSTAFENFTFISEEHLTM